MSKERIRIMDGRKPGWYWAAHEVIDVYGPELGPYGLAIYHALCRHANSEGESWPSYATLARETGMTRPQVINTMKRLVELELVTKKPREDEAGDPTSNLYTLLEVGGGASHRLGGSKPHLLGVGNEVYQGSKPGLPKEEPLSENQEKKNHHQVDGGDEELLVSFSKKLLSDEGVFPADAEELAKSKSLEDIASTIRGLPEKADDHAALLVWRLRNGKVNHQASLGRKNFSRDSVMSGLIYSRTFWRDIEAGKGFSEESIKAMKGYLGVKEVEA